MLMPSQYTPPPVHIVASSALPYAPGCQALQRRGRRLQQVCQAGAFKGLVHSFVDV